MQRQTMKIALAIDNRVGFAEAQRPFASATDAIPLGLGGDSH